MHPTPASLLQRLRQPHDQGAWQHFVRLYLFVHIPAHVAVFLDANIFIYYFAPNPALRCTYQAAPPWAPCSGRR